jgi:outer membrane immunogenic protein
MKNLLLASVGILALGISTASAADISRREVMPAKAPVYVSQLYNWTGAYVGINGGYGWGTSSFSGPLVGSSSPSGGLIGGTLGYNYQVGQAVLGLEGDLDWSNINGSATCAVGISCSTRNNWLGTTRVRLGYAADRFMPYVTGGAAFGDISTSATGFADAHSNKVGWTLGGGVEAAIAGPWTAKLEYLYVDLGHGGTIAASNASFHTNIVRAGLNYRF